MSGIDYQSNASIGRQAFAVKPSSAYTAINVEKVPEIGISTRIKELSGTIQETERGTNQILDSLGLNIPSSDETNGLDPRNIQGILASIVYRLQFLNSQLDRAIQHINS